jgi:hypothetical protein
MAGRVRLALGGAPFANLRAQAANVSEQCGTPAHEGDAEGTEVAAVSTGPGTRLHPGHPDAGITAMLALLETD